MFKFCVCGHEIDEHDSGRECMAAQDDGVTPCDCIHFEEDEG